MIVTDELELAVKVSLAELVVLQVPKSIVKDPDPTVEPVLLYELEAKVCVEASEETINEESIFSVPVVVPVVVKFAIVVLLEEPI